MEIVAARTLNHATREEGAEAMSTRNDMKLNLNSTESQRQESLRIVGHILHWDQWVALVALAGIFLFREGWYSVILWLVILLGAGFALVFRLTRPEDSL